MPDTAEPPVSNDTLPKREDFNTYYDDDITVPGAFLIRDQLEKNAKKEIVEEKQDDATKTDRERYFDRFKVEDEELKKEIPSDEISEARIKQEEENSLILNRRIIQTEDRRMKRGFFDGPDMRQDARIIEDAQQKFQNQQNITSEARIAYWQQKVADEKRKQEEERQNVWHPKVIQTIISDKEMKRVLMGSPPNGKSTRTEKKPKIDSGALPQAAQQESIAQEADPDLVENPVTQASLTASEVTLQPTVTFESMNEDLVKAREELLQNNVFTSEEVKERRVQIYQEQQTKMAEQWLQEKQVLVEAFANVIHANKLGEGDVATIKKELELSFVDHNARIGLISRLEELYKITRTTKIGAESVDFYHQFKKALESIEGGIIYTHTEIIGKTYLELTQGGIPFEYTDRSNEVINIQSHKATAINHFGFKPNQGSLQQEIKAKVVFEEKLGITQRIAKTWNSVTDSIFGKIEEPVEQVKPESQTEPELFFDLEDVPLPKIPDIKLDAFVTEDELVEQYKQFVTSQQNQMTFDYQHLRREVFLAKYKLSEDIHPDELKNIDLNQLMKMAFAYHFADNSEDMLTKVAISDPSAPISQYSYTKFNDTNRYGFKFSPEELVKFDTVITSFEDRIKGFQEAERNVSLTTTQSLTTEPQVDLKTRNNVEKKYRLDLVIDLLKENGVTPNSEIVGGLLRAIATEETLNFGEDLLARRILDFLNENNLESNFSTSPRHRPIDPFSQEIFTAKFQASQSAPLQLDDLDEIASVTAEPSRVQNELQNPEAILQQLHAEIKKNRLDYQVNEVQSEAISKLQFKYIDQFIDTNEKPLQELLSTLKTLQAGYNYVPATIDEFKQILSIDNAKSNLSITGARYTLNQMFNALNTIDSPDQHQKELFENLRTALESVTLCNFFFPEELKKKSRTELVDLGFRPYVNGVLRDRITPSDSIDRESFQVDFLGNFENTSLIIFKKETELADYITNYYHSNYIRDNSMDIQLRVSDAERSLYVDQSNSYENLFDELRIISDAIGNRRIKKEDFNINEIVNIQGKAADLWMKEKRIDSQTSSDFEVEKGIDTQINDSQLNEQEKMQLKDALNAIVVNGSYNHDKMLIFMKQIGTFVIHNKEDKNLGNVMDKFEELLQRVSAVRFIGREVIGRNIESLNNSYYYGNVWKTDQENLPTDAEVSEVVEFGFVPYTYFPIEYAEQKMKLKFKIPVSQNQNNNETT